MSIFGYEIASLNLLFHDLKQFLMQVKKRIYLIGFIVFINFYWHTNVGASSLVNNLPIVEFPASGPCNYFVLFFSGDGGWKAIDQSITANLNAKKVPVVALNIMKYLWSEKTKLQIAKDLELLVDVYLKKWNKQNVVIIGYSMGAEVLPFALNLTNSYYLAKISDLILIAPSQNASFKIKIKDYLLDDNKGQDVLSEVRLLKVKSKYCICDDKKYSICKKNLEGIIEYNVLTGGHHFDGDYSALNRLLSKRLKLD